MNAKQLAAKCTNEDLIQVGRISILAKQQDSPWGRAIFAEMKKRIDAAEAAAAEPLQVAVVDFGYKPPGCGTTGG